MSEQIILPPVAGAEIKGWGIGLTEKMVAFVDHYAQYRNATQAYTAAYDTEGCYETRRNGGARLLKDPKIQEAIKERQKIATDVSGANTAWLLNRFLQIATADPRELIGLKVGACRYCWGEAHGYHWREGEYLEECARIDADNAALRSMNRPANVAYPDVAGGLDYNATHPPHPSCPRCHGEGLERFVPRDTDKLSDSALLLYGGVKVKKDGYEIIIADQKKALELAGRILGSFTDNVKISGTVGAMVAVADLRKVDPQEASKAYRDMIAGHLTAAS